MLAWLIVGALVAGTSPDTTLTFSTPSDGVMRVALRSALVGRDTGVTVEVKNSGDSARRVVIRCEPLHGVAVADSLLKAQPETLVVPARASAATRVTLPAALAALPPGVYLSAIVATAGRATVRRQLVVTVDRLPPLMLTGSTWTVRVVRKVPGTRWFGIGRSALLPVPADADTGLLGSRGDSVGTALAGPMGAVAYAHRGGAIERLAPGVLGVPLTFDHLTTAGDYTGPLTLVPGFPDSKLTLTVRVTDCWIWPAVAILVGILLAYALQRYTTVDRVYMQLKASVLETLSQWTDVQQQYASALSPAVGTAADITYDLGSDFAQQCNALLENLEALVRPLMVALDGSNPAYAAAQQRLTTLQSVLTDWPAFAGELNALSSVLHEARGQATELKAPPPANAGTVPSADPPDVLAVALRLAQGKTITVADFASTRTAVTGMTTLLADWIDCAEHVVEDRKRIEHLRSHVDSGHKQAFDLMRGGVAQARNDLQSAKSAADLTRLGTRKTLDVAEGQLAQLEDALPTAQPKPAKKFRLLEGQQRFLVNRLNLIDLEAAPAAAEPPQEQAKRLLQQMRVEDYLFLVLTLLVAGLTGFKTLYLGQNSFGTLADYIAAILWGFGTKYTLETLMTVVGRFFQRA